MDTSTILTGQMQKYHSEIYDQTMTYPGNQTTISSETNRDPQNTIEETRRNTIQNNQQNTHRSTKVAL